MLISHFVSHGHGDLALTVLRFQICSATAKLTKEVLVSFVPSSFVKERALCGSARKGEAIVPVLRSAGAGSSAAASSASSRLLATISSLQLLPLE